MSKLIQLTLSKIHYQGDSIGDDIRIEVECLGSFLGLDKRIKRGSDVAVNTTVGQFSTSQTEFSLPITVRIIEKDLIFNDVGSAEKNIKVDAQNLQPQHATVSIVIEEKRNYTTKKKAVFEITFKVLVLDAIAYVKYQSGGDGWLEVVPVGDGDNFSIPYHLKIRLEKQDNGREYFTILEGDRRGTKASVRLDDDNSSFFQSESSHTPPVHFTYSLSTRILKLKTRKYQTLDYKDDEQSWQRRLYTIAIPDSPHKGGESYLDRAKLAKVWFKVSHSDNQRYLHTGERTGGCITIIEVERWDELCKILLKARRGDGKSVGEVEIGE